MIRRTANGEQRRANGSERSGISDQRTANRALRDFASIAAFACTLILPTLSYSAERPNFLFILVDDLGPEWMSCYGSEHQTPNIDRLAKSGMRFTNVWATPLCTPTRHELLTGRYPFRTGWTVHWDVPRWGPPSFDPKREITFARVLRDVGYATAAAGKWQINDLRTAPDVMKQHGFDEHCMWPGFEADNPPSAERYWNAYVQENGQRGTREGAFGPDVFTDFTIDFIRRHKDRPFLAYHAMVLTHTPFTTTPDNKGTSLEKGALHPGMVDYVDKIVGRYVRELEALGLAERTVVILTCDNGTVRGVPCEMNGLSVNGGKGTLHETGIHVPLIVRWPGPVAPGKVTEELVDFSDFFPTLVELAGAEAPKDVTLDGRSFAGVLLGRSSETPRREWAFSQLGPRRVIRDKRYKLWSDGRFFDLAKDPLEEHDLAGSHDPQVVAAGLRLRQRLERLPEGTRLPFGDKAIGQKTK